MRIGELSDAERRDWLRLGLSENIGPSTFAQLMVRYRDAASALAALPELARRGGLRRSIRVCPVERAEQYLTAANDHGMCMLAACESGFPDLLRNLDPPPPMIFAKGRVALANTPAIAIVGARNASAAGRKLARQIASDLGKTGFTIASGLARGIDTAAHEASLETGTIAVLGGGLDHIYPPENETLHRHIAERGLLISEMPPGTVAKAEHFPRRNRIISGLSLATVVVEAALRSGSLITARYAAEQGREVFAVPGSPLDPRSEGCNKLIREGATLLMNSNDIIEGIKNFPPRRIDTFAEPDETFQCNSQGLERDRQTLLGLLSPTPVDIDTLIRESGLRPEVVASTLLELELAGTATRLPRGLVTLNAHSEFS